MTTWIKTTDAMPDTGVSVLAWHTGCKMPFVLARFRNQPGSECYWDRPDDQGCDFTDEEITHWMHLPGAPE